MGSWMSSKTYSRSEDERAQRKGGRDKATRDTGRDSTGTSSRANQHRAPRRAFQKAFVIRLRIELRLRRRRLTSWEMRKLALSVQAMLMVAFVAVGNRVRGVKRSRERPSGVLRSKVDFIAPMSSVVDEVDEVGEDEDLGEGPEVIRPRVKWSELLDPLSGTSVEPLTRLPSVKLTWGAPARITVNDPLKPGLSRGLGRLSLPLGVGTLLGRLSAPPVHDSDAIDPMDVLNSAC